MGRESECPRNVLITALSVLVFASAVAAGLMYLYTRSLERSVEELQE